MALEESPCVAGVRQPRGKRRSYGTILNNPVSNDFMSAFTIMQPVHCVHKCEAMRMNCPVLLRAQTASLWDY